MKFFLPFIALCASNARTNTVRISFVLLQIAKILKHVANLLQDPGIHGKEAANSMHTHFERSFQAMCYWDMFIQSHKTCKRYHFAVPASAVHATANLMGETLITTAALT